MMMMMKKKKKKKIYNVHTVKRLNWRRRQLPGGRTELLFVNELGYEVRLEVALETV